MAAVGAAGQMGERRFKVDVKKDVGAKVGALISYCIVDLGTGSNAQSGRCRRLGFVVRGCPLH
jgi:hypothetical protein